MWKTVLALFFFNSVAFADQKLCENPDVIIVDGKFQIDSNEKILVCGSKQSKVAWRKVPLEQAQYQLNVLLQAEGYLNARFENDGDSLKVFKGDRTETKKLVLTGTNGVVDVDKKRKVVGEPMIPKKLDEVKEWAELASRRQGHACPDIQMRAQAWDQIMYGNIEPGPVQKIGKVTRSGYGTLNPEALRRFEAFESGDIYNVVDTQITVDRVMSQGLFQNAYITTACHDDDVDLNFISETGKPKLLRLSVGASTEEFPFADAWFKNSRLDDKASNFLAQLHASDIRQSFDLTSEFYIIPDSFRTFVGPRFKLERKKERSFESDKAEAGVDLGRAWDVSRIRLRGLIGPTFNYLNTVTGVAPDESTYLSWDASLSFMSHSYEAFSRTQFEGWIGDAKYITQIKDVGAHLNVDRLELRFKNLYNLKSYSPPLLIIANRIETVLVSPHGQDNIDQITDIPVDLRIFYGGNDNVRGFSRQALNNSGRGFITSALLGSEFRFVQVVPYNLEPFLLFDIAKLGTRQFEFITPTFLSYGGGLRWVSPFGTLRFSGARGQIWNNTTETSVYAREWVLNVSFGQEF